jgi:hypothetical protein
MLSGKHGGEMTIAYDLNAHITGIKPRAICDDCLQDALKLSQRQQAALRTETLGTTSDFVRERDECSVCHSEKQVIRRA